jgi:hypothetical protein
LKEKEYSLNKEDAIKTLEITISWINSCDMKTSIVLALFGIFIILFLSFDSIVLIKRILDKNFINENLFTYLYLIMFCMGIVIFLYGLYYLVRVLIPRHRFKSEEKNRKYNSIMTYALIAKLVKLVRGLIPRQHLKSKEEKENKKEESKEYNSIMFYGEIAKMDTYETYFNKVRNYTEYDLLEDILYQIYACSKICNKKMSYNKKGLLLALLGIVITSSTIFIGYIVYLL